MKQHFSKCLLPLGLCGLMSMDGLVPAAFAQNPPKLPSHIEIVIVEGEGATNKTHQRVTPDPVVRVEDDDHRPLSDAAVVFALPVSGTTGEFSNGSKTLTVVTDHNGRAAARGLRT